MANFGISVGDFVTVGTLAWNVYRSCELSLPLAQTLPNIHFRQSASAEFEEVSREVISLHAAIKELEDEAGKTNSLLKNASDTKRQELKQIIKNIRTVLGQLEKLVTKYQSLSSKHRKKWDIFKFGTEGLNEIRSKVVFHTSAINLFLTTLNTESLSRIEKKLDDIVNEFRRGDRDASSVAQLDEDVPEAEEQWQTLKTELIDHGFTRQDIEVHKEWIKARLHELIIGTDPPLETLFLIDSTDIDKSLHRSGLPGTPDLSAPPSPMCPPLNFSCPQVKKSQYLQSPPRNEISYTSCDHLDCASGPTQPSFSRWSDWKRHMEGHENLYACGEPGCALSARFAGSDLLLQHQREVHEMHGGSSASVYSPHEDGESSRKPTLRLPVVASKGDLATSATTNRPGQSSVRPTVLPRARLPPRLRTGCWTCRTRKVKCDESRPVCSQCTRLGHDCDYNPRLSKPSMKRRASSPPLEAQRSPTGPGIDQIEIVSMSPASDRMPSLRHRTSDASLANSVHSDVTEYDSSGHMSRRTVTKTDTYAYSKTTNEEVERSNTKWRTRMRVMSERLDKALSILHLAGMSKTRYHRDVSVEMNFGDEYETSVKDAMTTISSIDLYQRLQQIERKAEGWAARSTLEQSTIWASTWEEYWE